MFDKSPFSVSVLSIRLRSNKQRLARVESSSSETRSSLEDFARFRSFRDHVGSGTLKSFEERFLRTRVDLQRKHRDDRDNIDLYRPPSGCQRKQPSRRQDEVISDAPMTLGTFCTRICRLYGGLARMRVGDGSRHDFIIVLIERSLSKSTHHHDVLENHLSDSSRSRCGGTH